VREVPAGFPADRKIKGGEAVTVNIPK
jgi:hypothetical protein